MKVAAIYLNQTNKRIDKPYDYAIPAGLEQNVRPGMRVAVPFGRGSRMLEGFVIQVKEETAFFDRLRPIEAIIDTEPILSAKQIALCQTIKDTCCSLFYEALSLFTVPVKLSRQKAQSPAAEEGALWRFKPYRASETIYHLEADQPQRGKVQQKIVDLLRQGDLSRREILERLGDVGGSLRSLCQKGIVSSSEADDLPVRPMTTPHAPSLSEKEATLYARMMHVSHAALLLPGGDMRLKLYLKAAEECLKEGKSALILFPDVHLTLQTRDAFYQHFGKMAAVCHGDMSQKERYQLFRQCQNGSVRVLIGARSALFLPLKDVGVIIVDEEQDSSYYASAMPCYDTVKVAERWAELTKAKLILGASLPSVRLYRACENGQYTPVPHLMNQMNLNADVVDMQKEMHTGNFSFLSRRLKHAIDRSLASKKTVVLLINRRGYASHVFCRDCGYVEKCPTCGIPLKYYDKNHVLKCPTCGYIKEKTACCPQCGSPKIREMGMGIDQAAEKIKEIFPGKRVLRLSSETLPDYNTYQKYREELLQGKWDIVLGTQILLRPFPFDNVGVAAALLIDGDLNRGNYQTAETAWQLYGRLFERMPQEAVTIVQTYEPDNPVVCALATGDTQTFYAQEYTFREMLGYPPAGHLIRFSIFHADAKTALENSKELYSALSRQTQVEQGKVEVLEPFLAGRIVGNGQICYKMLLKTKNIEWFYCMCRQLINEGAIEACAAKVAIAVDPPSA